MTLHIFFSWQVQTNDQGFNNKSFLIACIQNVCNEIGNKGKLKGVVFKLHQGLGGVSGTPSVSAKMMELIDNCDIFIGDMTVTTPNSWLLNLGSKLNLIKGLRREPNSNVYGEFHRALGKSKEFEEQIILVMNDVNGTPEDDTQLIPFDSRDRRFPITFHLKNNGQEDAAKKKLMEALKAALQQSALAALKNIGKKYIPFIGWQEQAKNPKLSGKFIWTTKLRDYKAQLINGKSIIRLLGLSGLGKTKLVLECFRDSDVNVHYLYCDCQRTTIEKLENKLSFFFKEYKEAVLVLDNCNKETLNHVVDLKCITQNVNNTIITIFHEPEERQRQDVNYIILDNSDAEHKSQEYSNDQEYLVALELPLGLYEYFWGDKIFFVRSEAIQAKIEDLVSKNKDIMRISDYFSRLQKEVRKEEKVKPLGRSGRTITFGSSDSTALGAIRILQVLVKMGFIARNMFARWVSNESLFLIVERIYALYPYPCLYFASLCTNKDFSKRVAQLYCFSSSEKIQNVLPDILVKILKACHSENLSEERKNVLYIYATSFIKRVHPRYWRKEFKTLYRKQNLGIRNEREFYETKYTFAQQAIAYMDDASFSLEIIDSILEKGAGITHNDNALLIAAAKNIKELSKEQIRKVYSLMDNTMNEAQVFILFNMRNFIAKRKFYDWLDHLDKKLLKSPSLILAVSQVARKCKRFENLALSLLEESDSLWSTGINEQNEHIFVSGTQSINVDSFDRDVHITGDAEIKAFNLIKTELALLEKAQQSRFYEDWFQDWSTEVYSMKLFLVRHYKSFENSKEVDELIKKCEHLYFCISGQNSLQEKLIHQESYKVEEGIKELMKGVRTYGIKNFFLEYEIIANIILQHKTKALDMCIRHFSWAVAYKKYQKFFVSHNFQHIVLLILRVYKPYFIGKDIEEWDLNADKNVVEDCMINMNRWLKSFGLEDADWEKYKPIFYYKEL
jgi:CRISPR/Cas system CSM-associated protein Csm2 small subunit